MIKMTSMHARLGAFAMLLLAATGCGSSGDGENGENGSRGADGSVGSQGENGSDGKDGVAGKDGSKGADGVDGQDGTVGEDGVYRLPPSGNALQVLSSYNSGLFGESAAEIVAHHPGTQQVFVVNAARGQIQILKLSSLGQLSDSEKVLDPDSDLSGFDVGGVNSVAVYGDLVAVAVENDSKVLAGKVAFYDAQTLEYISSVDAGALPDMLAFTPDGQKLLVANEGEQDRVDEDEDEEFQVLADPAGSVTIVDLSAGVESATVTHLDFTAFDAQLEVFRAQGVRYFPGDLATGSTAAAPRPLSDDLEPEYIAISPDGMQAFVTLQEANSFAVIDLSAEPPVISDIRPLGVKDFSRGLPVVHSYEIPDDARPSILADVDTSAGVQDLLLGGLSALYYEKHAGDVYSFLTVPDRGPQIDPADLNAEHAGNERPHVMGDSYQATVYRYSFDADEEEFTGMPDAIPLFQNAEAACKPVRGLANSATLDASEYAVDLQGNPLGWNALDGDFEGLALDPDGDGYWMVDEYRPAIYYFSKETSGCAAGEHGVMQYRLVPDGTSAADKANETLSVWAGALSTSGETLPARYGERRANRGFEAVAIDAASEILYAFIQSPLDYAGAREHQVIRILGVDIDETSGSFGQPVSEYVYLLEGSATGGNADKIGDAVFDAETGRMLVIERDSSFGPEGKKYVYEIDIAGSTNTLNLDDAAAPLETLSADEIMATYDIKPVTKRKILNLPSIGYVAGDKPEGLALITEGSLAGSLAVLNDNDFGLEPALEGGKVVFSTEYEKPVLGLITFDQSNGLDASDRDDAINITNHPVFGMYMPDAVASFAVDGRNFYLTANEGDSRDYDEARVKDIDNDSGLDASYGKVEDEDFGRLKLSLWDGDRDYDGDIDDIYSYGARSFSVWDSLGNLVWDSGDDFERITATAFPYDFNSTNDENMSFDNRSDDKGPEPEGVVVGQIGDKTFAFIGLERMGGIMIYDVSEPQSPAFVDYVSSRHFAGSEAYGLAGDLGPEGLEFIAAADSPTGAPLLLVGHEVSGTTTVFQIDLQ